MKRWWIVLLLLLSVGLNIGLLAQRGREKRDWRARLEGPRFDPSQGGEPRERPPLLDHLLRKMVDEVGVTGEQREKFVAIQENFFSRTLATRERLRHTQKALRENLSSPQPDRALADLQAAELAAAQKEIEAAFIDNFFAASAILDPDQQKRYRKLVSELRRIRWDRQSRTAEERDERRQRRDRRHDADADRDPPGN